MSEESPSHSSGSHFDWSLLPTLLSTSSAIPTDITFKVVDKEDQVVANLEAHKMIVALHSDHFKNALYGSGVNFKEDREGIMVIKETTKDAFEDFLGFLYEKKIDFKSKNLGELFEILNLAERYQVRELKDMTVEVFKNIPIAMDNVVDMAATAEEFSHFDAMSKAVYSRCVAFIEGQFTNAQSVIEFIQRNEDKATVIKLVNDVKIVMDDTKTPRLAKFKTDLQRMVNKTLVKGEAWFLVDNHWFKRAKKYLAWEESLVNSTRNVRDDSANPGPIDNKPLWKENGSDIREHMIGEIDYVVVPDLAWDMLVAEFGLKDNVEGTSSAVKRNVIEDGMFVKQLKVEVYLIELQVAENSNMGEQKMKKFSRTDTLAEVQNVIKELFGIPALEETRLWYKYNSYSYEQLSRLDMTVSDAGLFSGQLVFIERKNEDGSWPRQA